LCTFTFGHTIGYPSSLYGFCLPLWYLETFLTGDNVLGITATIKTVKIEKSTSNLITIVKIHRGKHLHIFILRVRFVLILNAFQVKIRCPDWFLCIKDTRFVISICFLLFYTIIHALMFCVIIVKAATTSSNLIFRVAFS